MMSSQNTTGGAFTAIGAPGASRWSGKWRRGEEGKEIGGMEGKVGGKGQTGKGIEGEGVMVFCYIKIILMPLMPSLGRIFRATVGTTTFQSTTSGAGTIENGFQGYAVASGRILQKTTEGILVRLAGMSY